MSEQQNVPVNHPLVLEALLNTRWAVKPETFELIVGIVQGQGDEKQAAAIRGSRLSNETRNVELLGQGIAILPIVGPIVPRASLFSEVSGLASAQGLQKDFAAAIDDLSVKSIVFDVDSPGGAVTGIAELSQMIFEARGKKPITAYVRGLGASAAYWVLSAADRIVVAPTAELGSIGVVMGYSRREPDKSIQSIEIVSSLSPKKRLDPLTPEGKQAYQEVVDELAIVMVSNIARNRGVSAEQVTSQFGEGFVLVGQKAVDRKMADSVSTFDAVVTHEMARNNKKGVLFMADKDKTYTQAETDALIAEARKEGETIGRAAGAKAERERIQSIEAVQAPGHEALVADMKFKEGTTAADVALAVVQAQAKVRQAAAAATTTDATRLAEQATGAGNATPAKGADEKNAGLAAAIAGGANARRTLNTAKA